MATKRKDTAPASPAKAAAEPAKKSEVVTLSPTGSAPPAALMGRARADAGKGVSSSQDDNIVPLIYVLQSNSPQVDKRSPDYIEGAETGDLWLRSAPNPIVRGEEGFLFQPCYFSKDWVEWRPRSIGGGFVGRHESLPEDAELKPDPQNPQKMRHYLPNGNEIIETRYHAGFVVSDDGKLAMPYLIPMTSTGHTTSKNWMFMMNNKQADGMLAPSWMCLYRLRTRARSNAAGNWMGWEISDAGWIQTEAEYERGQALYNAFLSGEKRAEDEVNAGGEVAAGEDAPM